MNRTINKPRKSRQICKPLKNIPKCSTAEYLERLAVIVDHPGNQSFQWGEGRSVVVNAELYEKELSRCEELSTFKQLKDVPALHAVMLTHGFKKMARQSSGDVHVFQHPNFSNIKLFQHKGGVRRKSESAGSSGSTSLKNAHEPQLMDRQRASVSVPTSSHLFPTATRRHVRSLYPYINYDLGVPDSHHSQETQSSSSSSG